MSVPEELTMTLRGRDNSYRIVGMDIGSNFGICIADIDLSTMTLSTVDVFTVIGEQHKKSYPYLLEAYPGIQSVLYGHRVILDDVLKVYSPDAVVLEQPFLNRRFPHSYGSLIQHVAMIHQAVIAHNPYLPLYTPSPVELKYATGITGKITSDKELMRTHVARLPIAFRQQTPLMDLDEHSVDSIAATYWLYKRIVSEHSQTSHYYKG